MPILVASDPKSETTASICSATSAASTALTRTTPREFWTVKAVIAEVPYTRCAAKVLRSACTPAPPLGSLPAIVSAVCISLESSDMSANVSTGSLLDYSIADSPLRPPIRVAAVGVAFALTAVAAQFTFPLPYTSVPFVLTPMVVLLSGAALGSRLGAITQALYILAGVAGLPVFAPSATLPPGVLRLFGPTGGYLMAYPLAAFVAGYLAERGWDRRYLTSVAAMLIGLAIIFIGGLSWLTTLTHSVPVAAAQGLLPFVALDVIKVLVAAAILPRAWRILG